ncbi:family 78 glycoside hydrolase catalytic domain [Dactylosporangium sp. CA-233914]|uniref:alpha-L-rhamnosidase n=1 Tax=Dactylosporangium sp. CA-233914 TaxID=3239934 RepID=UPI003D93BC51
MPSVLTDLRTDGQREPLGIGSDAPEFSWRVASANASPQDAWEIEVSTSAEFAGGDIVWASGQVRGSSPFGVRYAGAGLGSASVYHWRVRVWTAKESEPSPWIASRFETGLLKDDDWKAAWVGGPARGAKDPATTLYLRGTALIDSEVVRARAYVSSLGWHRLLLNGEDLTGPALVPRWTAFDEEVEYVAYDVTHALATGPNVIGMVVGDGRFRGSNGFENHTRIYGDRLAGLLHIVAELADGTEQIIVTDGSWSAGTGRIKESDPKRGERADLRVPEDWARVPELPSGFARVEVLTHPRRLVAESVGRVRQVDELVPVAISRTKDGAQVVDFGQNFAGVVRIRLRGSIGTEVTLTHTEVLKPDGTPDLDYIHIVPWGRWYQRDVAVLGGDDVLWQPWFTIHGFRYVEVRGLVADLEPDEVRGIVMSSDLEQAGEFESSDPRLNRLWKNVEWSLRSNFMDTPTDCPTRERSGWTGDIQVFAPTATLFVDAQWYLRRYLHNLAVEQGTDGTVPAVIPSGFSQFSGGPRGRLASAGTAAGWGDASVLVPWTLYQYYGDKRVLEDQYESMVAWVQSSKRLARESTSRARRGAARRDPETESHIIDGGFQFGEWLRPGENAILSSIDARRRGAVVATAYFERSARVLSQVASVLGRDSDHVQYLALADRVRRAWRSAFLGADGRIGTDRQDDYVRALAFGLLDDSERRAAAARLVSLIKKAGGHLGTGFLSTPMLLGTLVDTGHADVAWDLLLTTSSPSWLYQVEHGATTVWETWEGYTKSGKAKMSHNHYAFGSVARFLIERLAGLSPAEPGYQAITVNPMVGGGLTFVRSSVQTVFGRAASAWRMDGDDVEYTVTVPPGTTARFQPVGHERAETLGPGTHTLRRAREA